MIRQPPFKFEPALRRVYLGLVNNQNYAQNLAIISDYLESWLIYNAHQAQNKFQKQRRIKMATQQQWYNHNNINRADKKVNVKEQGQKGSKKEKKIVEAKV